jgi:two-component system, sensor histidine kinase and response regulator
MSEFDADREFLQDILEGFLKNVRGQLGIIGEAIRNGNAETVHKEAHSIKGGAANICADDLSKTALEMELLGKSGSVDSGDEVLTRMEKEFVRLDEYYRDELSR